MINHRIIPVLLVQDGYLYKTINFQNPSYIGDPINAVKIFNEKEVDELVILDIGISKKGKEPNFDLVNNLASECFMPVTYGGGIDSLDKASRIFDLGIEKVIINSSIEDLNLISNIARRYGKQSLVTSIDYRYNFLRTKRIPYRLSGTKRINANILDLVKKCESSGAGELMIQSIDNDGIMEGYDIDFLKIIKDKVSVPIIICGGAKNYDDFYKAKLFGASGLAAGSFFIYKGPHKAVLINYPDQKIIKKILKKKV